MAPKKKPNRAPPDRAQEARQEKDRAPPDRAQEARQKKKRTRSAWAQEARRKNNRQSAQRSRERKEFYLRHLEELVASRDQEAAALREELNLINVSWCRALNRGQLPGSLLKALAQDEITSSISAWQQAALQEELDLSASWCESLDRGQLPDSLLEALARDEPIGLISAWQQTVFENRQQSFLSSPAECQPACVPLPSPSSPGYEALSASITEALPYWSLLLSGLESPGPGVACTDPLQKETADITPARCCASRLLARASLQATNLLESCRAAPMCCCASRLLARASLQATNLLESCRAAPMCCCAFRPACSGFEAS